MLVRILISADMEGATGVTYTADVVVGTEQWRRFRSLFTGDVNACIAGLSDSGATDVLVNEAHSSQRNLLLEELDVRARMLTGRHKPLSMMQGIDSGVDGVVFLGYHAGAGVDGVLAHTYLENSIMVQGHLDVVPAARADWSVPPFAGEIANGFVWGRGAVDMKDFVAMVLSVLWDWSVTGRRPRRDIVLAFVADEEDRGDDGAHWLVDTHRELFDGCAAAISESGGYTYHARRTDGSPVRLYPVATAERGTSHLRLTATGRAGHGSRRNDDNAIIALVGTLDRLAAYPWPIRLTATVRAFLDRACAALGVEPDLSDVDATLARLGSAAVIVENTVRNSTTPTVLTAGYKVNVIPSVAEAEVDVRVLPGTEDELLSAVDAMLGRGVSREFIARQPAVQAPVDSSWFDAMADALRAEDPDAVVLPYCMGGGTDAKAFAGLGIDCYGFSPLLLPDGFDYRAMAHGVDERVPVEGLRFGARVLDRFLSTC